MKQFRRIIALVFVVFLSVSLMGCKKKVKFEYWNDCTALTSLKEYVKDVTNKNSKDFIPVEDRIAVFDMDGTLCGELFPEYLEYLLLEYRCLDDPDYNASDDLKEVAMQIKESGKNYKTPAIDHYDLIHGRAQAKAFAGMTPENFISYVKTFLERDAQGFKNLKYKDSIYKPMIEVVAYLQDNLFTTYIVSGSDRFICRAIASETLNIPYSQIIGMDTTLVATNQGDTDGLDYQFKIDGTDEVLKGDELWLKNLKMNKVVNIVQEIGKQPVLSFGNSSGDVAMHNYTITNNKYKAMAFMLIADDTERDHADLTETNKRKESWEKAGYTIVSMKNDFKTIYGYDVVLVK